MDEFDGLHGDALERIRSPQRSAQRFRVRGAHPPTAFAAGQKMFAFSPAPEQFLSTRTRSRPEKPGSTCCGENGML